MNRTALSVIALAVGAVLIIGLFNVYKPQVTNTAHDIFDKVHIGRMETGEQSTTNDNKPDKYGVTPSEWKKGVYVNTLQSVSDYDRDNAIKADGYDPYVQYRGHDWKYVGLGEKKAYSNIENEIERASGNMNYMGYFTYCQYNKNENSLMIYE